MRTGERQPPRKKEGGNHLHLRRGEMYTRRERAQRRGKKSPELVKEKGPVQNRGRKGD